MLAARKAKPQKLHFIFALKGFTVRTSQFVRLMQKEFYFVCILNCSIESGRTNVSPNSSVRVLIFAEIGEDELMKKAIEIIN